MSNNKKEPCYPRPESQGGWRYLFDTDEIREKAGMDARKLDRFFELQGNLYGGDSWSCIVVRHGYVAREYHTFNVLAHSRFDIWSATKSFTGTAWGLLLDDSREGRLPEGRRVCLESPAYQYLPEGYPLSDPLKEKILVKHLLSMVSGLPGEDAGVVGMPTTADRGPFEHALGRCPNRYGYWADKLAAEPGARFDYSDAGMCHLAMMFRNIAGVEMSDFLEKRIFNPIRIENASWDVQGGGGFLGPHTNAHTGIHISARELARFGYLMLRGGVWEGRQLVPEWWVDAATKSSQELNPGYGYTWWVNTAGTCWPGLPLDMFAAMGYRSNKCYIVPSLDLVVVRVGSGPNTWSEPGFMPGIVQAITE